jgi:hypothetical protein
MNATFNYDMLITEKHCVIIYHLIGVLQLMNVYEISLQCRVLHNLSIYSIYYEDQSASSSLTDADNYVNIRNLLDQIFNTLKKKANVRLSP